MGVVGTDILLSFTDRFLSDAAWLAGNDDARFMNEVALRLQD